MFQVAQLFRYWNRGSDTMCECLNLGRVGRVAPRVGEGSEGLGVWEQRCSARPPLTVALEEAHPIPMSNYKANLLINRFKQRLTRHTR